MNINITTSIDNVLWQKAKDNDISWSNALEFGIQFLTAEREGIDYPPCKLLGRIANLQTALSQKCQEVEDLKNPTGENIDTQKEADDILNNIGKPTE
jgi:hypothetical protein